MMSLPLRVVGQIAQAGAESEPQLQKSPASIHEWEES